MTYIYVEDMREIGGLGKDYEAACRRMVVAGLEWWDAKAEFDPRWDSFESLFAGRPVEENSDTKMLEAAVGASESGCSGAQVGAAMSHIMFIKKRGWDKYVVEMTMFKAWYEELKIIAGKYGESVEDMDGWREGFEDNPDQSAADAFYEEYPEHREGE